MSSNKVATTSTQNIVPVQAEFDVNGNCLGLVGPGGVFFSPPISTDTITNSTITNSTINSTSIGATTPSTGAFTTLSSTQDASIHGVTVGLGGGSVSTNTVVGNGLTLNATGARNSAFGNNALLYNTASDNSAFGNASLFSNTSGTYNVAIGGSALAFNTTASNNTAVGYQSLYSNTTASNNTAVGYQAGYSNTTGSNNIAIGQQALYGNTTSSYNVAIGSSIPGFFNPALYSTTGTQNTAIGTAAGSGNTTGNVNVYVGSTTQAGATGTGNSNIMIGYGAGYANTSGANNTFVGGGNYGFYYGAGSGNTTGTANTYVGFSAGNVMTTGSYNTILGGYNGNQGGLDIRTSSNYIVLSDGAGNPRGIFDNSGNLLVGTTSNTNGSRIFVVPSANTSPAFACQGVTGDVGNPAAIFGKFDNNTTTSQIFVRFTLNNNSAGSGQITANGANTAAFGTYSDKRLKQNIVDLPPQLDNILALRPTEFDYIESEGGGHQIGFIAQEMEEIYPDSVGEREDGMKMIAGWDKTTARLVKALQEQQAIIEKLEARIATLEAKQ